MAGDAPVVLTQESFLQLKRELQGLRSQCRNLTRSMAHSGHRGYQGGYAPGFSRVKFQNDSSETVPAYGVMRITGASSGGYLTINKPNTTFQRAYLVNGNKDVDAGRQGYGRFLFSQANNFKDHYVLYDSADTPALFEEWGPKSGEWELFKNRPGFVIMGGTMGTGATSRVAVVGDLVRQVYGLADAQITVGSAGTVRVYGGSAGSETDTGQTIASCYNKTSLIADEAVVTVSWLHGKPYVAKLVC